MNRVLVDYRCSGCGRVTESWVARPVPDTRPSPCCGAEARRRFGGSILGRAGTAGKPGPAPEIPGLCTLSPTAARAMTARVRGDTRALEREIAHQEATRPTTAVTPFRGAPSTQQGKDNSR